MYFILKLVYVIFDQNLYFAQLIEPKNMKRSPLKGCTMYYIVKFA